MALLEKHQLSEVGKRRRHRRNCLCEFILGTDGKVQSAKVLRGIGGGCDEEVLNAVLRMPAWNPAKQGNVEVPLRMTIPSPSRFHS